MKKNRRKFLTQSSEWILGAGLMGTGIPDLAGLQRFQEAKQHTSLVDEIQIGILGTGGRGMNLINNINTLAGASIVGCCDVIPFRLERALKECPSAKGYSDYRALLDDSTIDAVVIATPLSLHFEMAKATLEAGKHLYCEKTMTFTIEETKELEHIVKNADAKFQVGYQHRFNPIYQKVLDAISNEDFGPLSHIESYWNRNGDWRRPVPDSKWERLINWRMYKEYSGGLLAELSSHQINIVNWMLDSVPNKVVGFGGIDYWKDGRETYDNIHTIFEYPNGVKHTCTSLTTNAQMGFQMKFYGKNATIQLLRTNNYQAKLFIEPAYFRDIATKDDQVDGVSAATLPYAEGEAILIHETDPGKEDAEPTKVALKGFLDSIRNDSATLVDYESGRDSAICVALGNMAMESGSVIHMKDYV